MFGFLDMMGNHSSRKVARYEEDGITIDTCRVTDSDKPYETAIEHPSYNNGNWVVVELYDTKEAALVGHEKWVNKMSADDLPSELTDVSTSEVALLSSELGGNGWRKKQKV